MLRKVEAKEEEKGPGFQCKRGSKREPQSGEAAERGEWIIAVGLEPAD